MQTAYLPLQTLSKANPSFVGGFCKWWYVPRQYIASFGQVDPITQQLLMPPTLKSGKTWYGPVNVPDKKRGWKQTLAETKAGYYYKQLVTGVVEGNNSINHINRQNLLHHEVVIVGLLRAGHFFIILGNPESGLSYEEETDSGGDQFDLHQTTFSFTGEGDALVLTQFAFITSTPSPTAPVPIGPPVSGDIIHDFTYTCDGTEGTTLIFGDLNGKSVLLLSRENILMNEITSGTPTIREFNHAFANTFVFKTALQAGEVIKILYKD